MDTKEARTVFIITDEIHTDINEIYEAIVDEDPKAGVKIDAVINKLKQLKTNIKVSNEV